MKSAADRVKAHRARRAAGRLSLLIEVDEVATIEVLERARLLEPLRDHDREDIARAVERAVERLLALLADDDRR
jgi:hypothetical protein